MLTSVPAVGLSDNPPVTYVDSGLAKGAE